MSPAWPRPEILSQRGGRSIGYSRDFVLPLVIRPADSARTAHLRGRLDLGVCADVCVPVMLDVEIALPPDGRADPAIRDALGRRPVRRADAARCRLRPAADGVGLEVEMRAPPLGGAEAVAIEPSDPQLWVEDPRTDRDGGVLRATTVVRDAHGGPVALDRSGLRITAIGRDGAIETMGCAP